MSRSGPDLVYGGAANDGSNNDLGGDEGNDRIYGGGEATTFPEGDDATAGRGTTTTSECEDELSIS